MEDETLNFICWITGHGKDTIHQMWNDYFSSPKSKSIPMQLPVKVNFADIIEECAKIAESYEPDEKPDYITYASRDIRKLKLKYESKISA